MGDEAAASLMAERKRAGGRKRPLPERPSRDTPPPPQRRGTRAARTGVRATRAATSKKTSAKRLEARRSNLRRDVEDAPARADL